MNHYKFEELLEELDANSVKTLIEKNARYSSSEDCLHNFNVGGDIFGGTAAEACWGYLTKHLVALRDMVKRNDFSNRADFLEKCQDSINYIRFMWCIGNEGNENRTEANNEEENVPKPCIRTDNSGVYLSIDFKNYDDARGVIHAMHDIVMNYDNVTLADIYNLIDAKVSYNDAKIAWTSLRNVNIIEDLDAKTCTLNLPRPDIFDIKKEND
jgi:hypothetical protein